jgi:tetratricopeptide (TPR) repeat protein
MMPGETPKLEAENPVSELWATAAVRERFRVSDVLGEWLRTHESAGMDVQQAAMFASRDIQNVARSGLSADGGETLRLPTEIRLDVLKQLGAAVVRQVLEAVAAADLSPVERMLRRLLAGEDVVAPDNDRDELLALRIATSSATAAGVTPRYTEAELDAMIRRQDLMMTLGGPDLHRFVGRTRDLATIHRLWREGAAGVAIAGPGGMGKSLMVSRFVSDLMDAKEAERPAAIFHIDYDRRDLQEIGVSRASSLEILTSELMRQARRWLPPEAIENLQRFGASSSGPWASESISFSRSSRRGQAQGDLVSELGFLLCEKGPAKARIVLIFDSMEQILGHDDEAVRSIDYVAGRMRDAGVETFVICVSRNFADSDGIEYRLGRRIDLTQFTDEEARLYLANEADRSNVVLSDKIVDRVIATVGQSPLALRLAVSLMEKGDETFDPGQWAKTLRNDPERIQASLYDRILKRIRDPNLAKIARPGLLVRRLTEGVVEQVLAEPCGLKIAPGDAEKLLFKGHGEGQLFTANRADPDPRALWHRADVRALMLADLDTEVSDTVAQDINTRAIAYYLDRDDVISRTEELYHRLRMEQDAAEIDPRWTDTAGAALRGALEELPPASRSYVRRKLGSASLQAIDASAEISGADSELRQVVQRELQSIADGATPVATLERYNAAKMSGPLADLYAEGLLADGRIDELLSEAARLIETRDAPRQVRAAVSNIAGGALEGLGRLAEAADTFRTAVELATETSEEAVHIALSARIGALRTARKQDEIRHFAGFTRSRTRQIGKALQLVQRVYEGLSRRAVESREVVAELSPPDGANSINPLLFRMLVHLVESGEAFPGAIDNPERARDIAQRFGFSAGSPRELAGYLSKMVYGPEAPKVIEVIREEVDWTLERAVARPAVA